MALADDITRYFRTDFKPAPGEFSRYDQQFLLQKFQVRERGRENGAKDLPESDVTSLDSVEQQLADAIQNQALEDERRTKQQLAHYDGLLKTANPAGESARNRIRQHPGSPRLRRSRH